MSEQPPTGPKQNLNISDNASFENVQMGGIAGRDLNLNQIQGKVVNVTVYDRIHAPDGLSKQSAKKAKSLTHEEYLWRRVLLDKVKNFWIKGFLQNSLHTKALIELGLEKRLDLVQRAFGEMEEFPEKSRQLIPEDRKTIDIFNQMGAGRTLLILGEPGAGKTISLLKLAESLIARTEKDLSQPIPVVFNLSSWASKKQTISEWLIQELLDKYKVSKPLGKAWVEQQQLLLLLDGLDEVKVEHRNPCVQALNQFMQTHGVTEMVICSRIKDYEILSERLNLQSAICIQPLTDEQIYQYLNQAGAKLAALKALLQQDAKFREFATSPLILSVMSLTYQGCLSKELCSLNSTEGWQSRLFNNYIERMLQRRKNNPQYSQEKTIRWLIWLAKRMSEEKLTVFLIEQMQPSWLKINFQRWTYSIIIILLSGGTVGLIYGIIIVSFYPLSLAILVGVIIGSLAGIFWFLFRENIVPSSSLAFSYKRTINSLFKGSILGCLLGIILGIIFWIFFDFKIALDLLIRQGLSFGLITGIPLSLILSFNHYEIEKKQPIPNQGIWSSLKNSLLLGLIGLIIVQFISTSLPILDVLFCKLGINCYLNFSPSEIPLFAKIVAGMAFGLYGTGEVCIKHFILRLYLYLNNCKPWDYAKFLDYATERIFLQKIGGSYMFIHRMLLEHFAQMELEQRQN